MRSKFKKSTLALASFFLPAYVLEATEAAFAGNVTTTPGNLPWEAPLSTLTGDLSGPTAGLVALIAIFVAGLALVFGEDLGKFARTLLMIVIAIGFLVGASKIVAAIEGSAI